MAGVGALRPLCIALSPPLRLDPLIASQVEAWIGADCRYVGTKFIDSLKSHLRSLFGCVSGDVSFAVKRANANSRLSIHGKDEMVTLHLGPRPIPDERPVWCAALPVVLMHLSQPNTVD
jgi:hypothetical protein